MHPALVCSKLDHLLTTADEVRTVEGSGAGVCVLSGAEVRAQPSNSPLLRARIGGMRHAPVDQPCVETIKRYPRDVMHVDPAN